MQMQIQQTAKPILSDKTFDMLDVWLEETDPENEFGECCTGLFDVSDAGTVTLVGLCVEVEYGEVYYSAEQAKALISADRIHSLEIGLERGDLSFDGEAA